MTHHSQYTHCTFRSPPTNDRQLVTRHVRFLFLLTPLLVSCLLAWSWLYAFWGRVSLQGPGPPLMVGGDAGAGAGAAVEPLSAVLSWLPAQAVMWVVGGG